MAKYYVEVGYKTKRGGVALGMEVDAFGPEEAEEIGKDVALKGYSARKWCYTRVCEADKPHGPQTVRMAVRP